MRGKMLFRFFFLSTLLVSFNQLNAENTQELLLTSQEIQPFEPLIVKLRMEELSKFPYLIWNGEEFEKEYASTYGKSLNGATAFAYKNDLVVGLLTGVSLKEYDEGLGQYGCPLISYQLRGVIDDPATVYHLGEIIATELNWEETITKLFRLLESHARLLGFNSMSFITIIREEGYPHMPPNYKDLESPLLLKLGYHKTGRVIPYNWPTLQPDGSTPYLDNTCDIWIKKLDQGLD